MLGKDKVSNFSLLDFIKNSFEWKFSFLEIIDWSNALRKLEEKHDQIFSNVVSATTFPKHMHDHLLGHAITIVSADPSTEYSQKL